jgi:hypothetical protein
MKEIWKDIPNYEGLYQVSNVGRVRSLNNNYVDSIGRNNRTSGKMLKQKVTLPYNRVTLCKKGIHEDFYTHKLVVLAFIPNPETKPQANHINGIKRDNRVENLEWVTHQENVQHAIRTGLMNNDGENQTNSKLKEKDILEIRYLYSHKTMVQIAKLYNISEGHTCRIINKQRWKHI